MKNKTFDDFLDETLKNPEDAAAYLKAALDESDMPEVFLLALRNVARARGFSKLAETTHLNRENLYRALSKKGNPKIANLVAILDAMGLRLSIETKTI